MSPILLLSVVVIYFAFLLFVSYWTGKGSNNDAFFIGNRNSNWMLVAFGMIGSSLSGVTFVSVPGAVGKDNFGYFQITIGYFIGYIVIAYILLPLYYRLKVTSIYSYLRERMGVVSEKSGATIFIVSRLVGATARLYLVVNILQITILGKLGVPFIATTIIAIVMILLYTYEGGVKTIVWTDTLQTTFMLAGLIICTIYILTHMDLSFGESLSLMHNEGFTQIFGTNPMEKNFFVKQIIAGAFITITMTGIDQEMMQKSLSVTHLKDSQKNMVTLGFIMLFVIGLFLYLGGLLHLYAGQESVNATGDALFPEIALEHMPGIISLIFIIALISALFPSADGAMTALTSSFCIDILGINQRNEWDDTKKKKIRKNVHLIVALSFLLMVLLFKVIDDGSMIWLILKLAGFTYGPLLGLFAFGIFTQRKVIDKWVPLICIIAPTLSYLIDHYQASIFGDFQIGLELLVINGVITFIGLLFISKKRAA
ncbi:MAG: sodium:solute symporter [Brumimicrobium sp.]|nr:sodium:solute symporter [Brumimicrobium sp.]